MTTPALEYFMREAIAEGKKALPHCLPNPPVGCVIVSQGQIVARGHTNPPGEDHAEAMALRALNGTYQELSLFVTLEPCSFHGRTPSCARLITNYPAQDVYVGIVDPHPKNQGQGIEILRKAGVKVYLGLLREEIQGILSPYLIHTS